MRSDAATAQLPQRAPSVGTTVSADARLGVILGLTAYGLWGVFPAYFKLIKEIPPLEVVAHRVLWSVPLLIVLLHVRRKWSAAVEAVRSRRTLATLALTTCLIAMNWLIFVWAVANNKVLQVSLGYFINPLLNVLLGFVFLRERLRPWQTISVLLAVIGVGWRSMTLGGVPLIALVLAASFGLYGLLRKTARVDALVGLTVETCLLWPIAFGWLVVLLVQGQSAFLSGTVTTDLILPLAGPVTALPLLLFTAAARRLRYSTLGFLQYLAPTGHFLLAVLAYGEPFTADHLVTFAFIWVGLLVFSVDALFATRAPQPAPLPE